LPAVAIGAVALFAISQLLAKEKVQPPETPDEEGRTSQDRLNHFVDDGPDFPSLFNMSAFVVRGPVKGGWPLVVDYEQLQPGRIEILVSARGAQNTYRFPMPRLAAGRHLIRLTLPEALGPDLRPAVVAVTAIGGNARQPATLADFSIYGLGAGPEAVGSVAIDQLGFSPQSIRVSRDETARYRFFSHSDFDTVSIEFLGLERAADGSRHRFVGRELLADGVRPDQWVGLDEPRTWDGRDDSDKVSVGSHRLQVRAWDRAGDWVCAWSPASVSVSE
jgi:hypothetical protein